LTQECSAGRRHSLFIRVACSGGPERARSEFFAQMKARGRFELSWTWAARMDALPFALPVRSRISGCAFRMPEPAWRCGASSIKPIAPSSKSIATPASPNRSSCSSQAQRRCQPRAQHPAATRPGRPVFPSRLKKAYNDLRSGCWHPRSPTQRVAPKVTCYPSRYSQDSLSVMYDPLSKRIGVWECRSQHAQHRIALSFCGTF